MSLLTDAKTYYKYLESITSKNNAASQKTADKMMAFQREMSDTAHQREVADLKAAGLNPVLSAGGQGASSPSGAMAQTDMSAASALTGYLQSLINQQTSLGAAMIQANAARDVAKINSESPNTLAGFARYVLKKTGWLDKATEAASGVSAESVQRGVEGFLKQVAKVCGIPVHDVAGVKSYMDYVNEHYPKMFDRLRHAMGFVVVHGKHYNKHGQYVSEYLASLQKIVNSGTYIQGVQR